MKRIELKSYAKINLCLDVGGVMEGGYHEVNMVMQQILLHDDVVIRWSPDNEGKDGEMTCSPSGRADTGEHGSDPADATPGREGEERIRISIGTNRRYLPTDRRNLAWQAAERMIREFGADRAGEIRIDMKKRIPVAAGLAGGSSNCAAVIHGMNLLWDLKLPLARLCEIGGELGSDVPFCVMGQAAEDPAVAPAFAGDPLATHCAVATGRGTDLRPIKGLRAHLVLSKPPISVSTAEAYRGVDAVEIPAHPDVEEMVRGLEAEDMALVRKNMVNVLENFTLNEYSIVVYTKDKMQELCNRDSVLMSGSGPTVFGICGSREEAKRCCDAMKRINRESFWTRTTV